MRYLATDASGNTASAVQSVTVVDDTPPVIGPMVDVVTFTGAGATACGTVVGNASLGIATATDNVPGSLAVIRGGVPAGNLFPVGTTTVTYTAVDASGNVATITQSVTVVDDTPPTIAAPSNVTRQATGVTTFVSDADLGAPSASDNCGSVTVITYVATDAAGSTATASQAVTVRPTTTSVCALVRSYVGDPGVARSLCAKLDAAAASRARGNTTAHDGQLDAFVNELNAQRGKAISDSNASVVIALAGAL